MKREIVVIFLLLLLSFPAVKALFIPGGFTSHDLTHHVVRQISMDKLLTGGQFPPRWSGELNNGYGYPVFLFNYPLPALVGEVFHKFGLGYVDSVKAVLFLSMVTSVVGMYLFLRSLLGSRLAAFLGSMFYLYAPLRFLTVYVSAAFGSALALSIVPFIFWSMVEVSKGKKWAIWVGGLFLALLILAHNVTTLIFAPVILGFAGFLIWRSEERVRVFREFGVMFVLGLGLSAWFWIPAVFEAQYTRFDEIFGAFYKDQFPTLWQLIRSPWGYGLSHPQRLEAGDMSYQLGLIHIGVMLVFSSWFLVYGRKSKDKAIGIFSLVTFLTSVFLMLKVSLPLWERLPFLSLVQFPVRFQALSVFSASITAALLVKYLSLKSLPVIARNEVTKQSTTLKRSPRFARDDVLRWVLFFSLLFLVIYANRNHWHINQVFDPGEDYYLKFKTTSTTYGEHLPKWGRLMEKEASSKLEFVRGMGPTSPRLRGVKEIRVIRDQSAMVLAEIETKDSAKLRLNQFYFPGWEIKVDGRKTQLNYLEKGESYGLPVFEVGAGSHKVLAEFKNTPVRNLADGVSLITFLFWLFFLFRISYIKN